MIALFQGSFIFLISLTYFYESEANLVLITFSALILIELLNVYTMINFLKLYMLLGTAVTLASYIISIYLLNGYFEVTYITWQFTYQILLVALGAWLPVHLLKILFQNWIPTEQQKILKQEKDQIEKSF